MEMKSSYITHFARAFAEALSEMAGQSCRAGDLRPLPETMVSYGMVVIVGITGARPGRMIMDTGRETARQISQLINGESYDIDDQFILYTMAELANIVSGKAISHINNMYRGLGLRLTPPGIFRGDLLQVSSPRINAEMISVSTPLGDFSLSVGFEGGK